MSKPAKASPIEKVAEFIVDKRKGFYLVYILLIIFSLFSSGWVSVNNEITDYLAEETETRQGLTLMDDEFITYATAQIMVDNISYSDAELVCAELEDTNGVKEIAFDDTQKAISLFTVKWLSFFLYYFKCINSVKTLFAALNS